MEALEHQAYPFDLMVDELLKERDLSRSPFFDIKVVLQNTEDLDGIRNLMGDDELKGITIGEYPYEPVGSIYDISFRFFEQGNEILLYIEFNTDLFTRQRIEQFFDHYINVFRQVIAQPLMPLSQVSYITEEERNKLLARYLNR